MRQHYLFALGTFAVGAVIGSLTVLSSSPVVSVVIPLLFGLIAGASGFLLAREDITQKAGRERLAFIGVCATSLCLGLMIAVTVTFWAQMSLYPKPLNDLAGGDRPLDYQEQMHAAEVRAVARMLGADPREQASIVQAAILQSRMQPETTADIETVRVFDEAFVEKLNAIAELAPIVIPEGQDPDSYSNYFNSTLLHARALLVLHETMGDTSAETDLRRDSLRSMMQPLGMLVGSSTSFPTSNFLRLSEENPDALAAMVDLRISGTKLVAQASDASSVQVYESNLIPQSRAELIRLLQGTTVAFGGEPAFGLNVAENFEPDFNTMWSPLPG